jgi:hypothetical protein
MLGTWCDAFISSIDNAVMLERIREATRTGRPAADAKFIQQLEVDRCHWVRVGWGHLLWALAIIGFYGHDLWVSFTSVEQANEARSGSQRAG